MQPGKGVDVDRQPVAPRPLAQLAHIVGEPRIRALSDAARALRHRLAGRTVWQVNSTATGGGVAELLHALLSYVPDLGGSSPWLVIDGDERFFELTKRLHNRIHGLAAGHDLDERDAEHYEEVSRVNALKIISRVRPGDLVVLHDPQTAGLAGHLHAHGAVVVWRCHIGAPAPSAIADGAWTFLRPYLSQAAVLVFSRPQYRPDFVPRDRAWVIQPSIDPYAAKNIDLDGPTVRAILHDAGILTGSGTAEIVAEDPPAEAAPVVAQISRWDRLKDMRGVMHAFADHIAAPAYLVLAGPQTDGVVDDPEGREVYAECVAAWTALPSPARRRVMLASLPMDDVERNAFMVNALQRYATVVSQKSLAEGFGLTVGEAMWKSRPVVGGAVGGILDQIAPGCGVLVDPADPVAFGKAVRGLLDNPASASAMGEAAHRHVHANFLGDTHLLRWIKLFHSVLA